MEKRVYMVMDTPWNLEADSKNRSWKNSDTHTTVGLLDTTIEEEAEIVADYETSDRWVLAGSNSIITSFDGTEEEAKEKAREWLRDNPRPSAMI